MRPEELLAGLKEPKGELALLDVRETRLFSECHLLYACSLPLSRLELKVGRMVPRLATPIILCDDNNGLAERAAAKLETFGYSDVSILDGGMPGWRDAGYEVFSGVYVPSKAFGEFVEATYDTPRVTARELADLKAAGTNMVILDSRPANEYHRMTIPGSINVPGAELVHRVHDLAPDAEKLVVVNCAGRTRSIIGAQSLINAGVANRVVALENGTMGWHLAGLALEYGQTRWAASPSLTARDWSRQAADRVARRFEVPTVDAKTLAQWQSEADTHSLYLCDVRTPDEYLAGHLPGSMSAPGGQLVQSTDGYVSTLGARIVLVDDDGVRATMTASWLIQMGRTNVHVLASGLAGADLEIGPEPRNVLGLEPPLSGLVVDVASLAGLQPGRDLQIIDLADSRAYAKGHIPGAWFAIRSRLADSIGKIPDSPIYLLTSPDGVLAQLAAPELSRSVRSSVKTLAGGTRAWIDAGFPLNEGGEHMADAADDVHLLPYDYPEGERERAMNDYLTWETGLLDPIARDGTARFRTYPA